MKIGMLAGEASGDLLGAHLLKELLDRDPTLLAEGVGGPAMISAGFHSLYDIERLSVMGLLEPLVRLPDLISLRRQVLHHFLAHKPDVFIGIDAPDFNLGLELKLHQANIPIVHYVSPSVWAWRQGRIHTIKKAVDVMLTLFPFEAEYYKRHDVPAKCVGHPLANSIPMHTDTMQAKRALHLDENVRYVALLPGSRDQELRHLAPIFLQAALLIHKSKPDIQFITAHVNEARYQSFKTYQQQIAPNLPVHCFTRRAHDVIAASDAVLVTSGTATLEVMLLKKPMVIAYRMPAVAYHLARWLVNVPFIGLPNLLAQEQIVPECIQNDAKPSVLAEHILNYLEHPQKTEALIKRFQEIHKTLQAAALTNVADVVINLVKGA